MRLGYFDAAEVSKILKVLDNSTPGVFSGSVLLPDWEFGFVVEYDEERTQHTASGFVSIAASE